MLPITSVKDSASPETTVRRRKTGRAVCVPTCELVGEPDAVNPHVRFDERGMETEHGREIGHRQTKGPETVNPCLNHCPPFDSTTDLSDLFPDADSFQTPSRLDLEFACEQLGGSVTLRQRLAELLQRLENHPGNDNAKADFLQTSQWRSPCRFDRARGGRRRKKPPEKRIKVGQSTSATPMPATSPSTAPRRLRGRRHRRAGRRAAEAVRELRPRITA